MTTPAAGAGRGGVDTLLVEDDAAIAGALVEGLARYGFDVRHVATAALALTSHHGAAMVLLDLGLPDGDGIDVCRRLRAESDVPIIIITARSDEVERVVGLELGADDYLSKPFGLRELVARMRAVLRRAETPARGVDEPPAPGGLRLDPAARRVFADGAEVALTPKEFDLLELLASRPGIVLTREDLIARVWDENHFGSTRTLDVHVGTLRRKLSGVVELQTVRGVGFRLEVVAPGTGG